MSSCVRDMRKWPRRDGWYALDEGQASEARQRNAGAANNRGKTETVAFDATTLRELIERAEVRSSQFERR